MSNTRLGLASINSLYFILRLLVLLHRVPLGGVPVGQGAGAQHDHRDDHEHDGHRRQQLRPDRRVGLLEGFAELLQPFGGTRERSHQHRLAGAALDLVLQNSAVLLGHVQPHLGHPVIQALLAARVQVRALQPPVEHLGVEGELTFAGHEAEFAGAHVQHDEDERLRVSVEEELVAVPVVVVAQFQDLFLGGAGMEAADAPEREIPDHLPGEGVAGSPHVEHTDALSKLHVGNIRAPRHISVITSSDACLVPVLELVLLVVVMGIQVVRVPGAWCALSGGGPALSSVSAGD